MRLLYREPIYTYNLFAVEMFVTTTELRIKLALTYANW